MPATDRLPRSCATACPVPRYGGAHTGAVGASHLVTVMALNVAPISPNVAVMSQSASPVPKLKVPKCHRMARRIALGETLLDSRRRPVRRSMRLPCRAIGCILVLPGSYSPLMKTAISIPDTVFDAADSLAKRMAVSRSELFRRAVEAYIEAHRHDRVREALDAVYAREPSAIDKGLAEMQAASLAREDW